MQTIKQGIVWFDIETPIEANDAMLYEGSAIAQIASIVTDFELNKIDQTDIKVLFKLSEANPLILQKIGYSKDVWAKEAYMPDVAATLFRDFVSQYACVTKVNHRGPYQSCILAGHNIRSFDIPLMIKWYKMINEHYGTTLYFPGSTNPSFDTRSLIGLYGFLRKEFFSSEALTYLCERFDINLGERHNALDDLEKTIEIARIITKQIRLI